MINCANFVCPLKNLFIRNESPPWITREIIESLHDRDAAYGKVHLTRNPNDLSKAKELRTSTKRDIRNACSEYIQNNLSNNSNNPRKFWEEINKIVKNKNSNNSIELKNDSGDLVPAEDTTNFINDFFSSIGPNLAKKFDCPKNSSLFEHTHHTNDPRTRPLNSLI